MHSVAPTQPQLRARIVALFPFVVACATDDDAPADTQSTASSADASSTANDDSLPLGPSDGGPATVGPDTDTSGMTEGVTDDDDSTSDDGPMGCTDDDECTEADEPFCVDMICSSCATTQDPDAACAEKFPETPACVASTCVQCSADVTDACARDTPICDTATNTCVACTSHDQCDGGAACDIATGACFPADAVFWEDGNAACPGMGTMAMPWCDLQSHIAELPVAGMMTVHLVSGTGNDENLFVDNGKRIALLGDVVNKAIFQPPVGNSTYTLNINSATSAVYIDGTRFTGNQAQPALRVNSGTLYVSRSEIVENSIGGVLAETGTQIGLENCFVEGGGANEPAAVLNGATGTITYSTFSNTAFTNTPALSCSNGTGLTIRNSIFVTEGGAGGAEFSCPAMTTYSAFESAVAGTGNVNVGPFPDGSPGDWFVDHELGDYHLQNDGLLDFAGIAQWQGGDAAMDILPDPLTDIDGQMRTAVDGSMSHAGADLP